MARNHLIIHVVTYEIQPAITASLAVKIVLSVVQTSSNTLGLEFGITTKTVYWDWGEGIAVPKPEKIGVKWQKIAVNCGKIAVKIAVHFFLVPKLYASHEQQWSRRFFCKKVFLTNYAPNWQFQHMLM